MYSTFNVDCTTHLRRQFLGLRMLYNTVAQIHTADTDEELQFLFSEQNSEKADDSIIYETGYRKALCKLTLKDVPELKQTLRDYSLVKVKAELDQFSEGLNTLGVLSKMKKYPALMAPLFTDCQTKKLDKGSCINNNYWPQ